jgi:hypothetical protein
MPLPVPTEAQQAEFVKKSVTMENRSRSTFSKKLVRKASVFLCLLAGATGWAEAQSYFHLQMQGTASAVTYNCFLRVEPDGSGILRMASTNNGTTFLVEVLMADSVASGTTRFLIPKTTPRVLQGTLDDSLWLPVIQFESRTDSTGLYYEPSSVLFILNGNKQQATLLTAKQKTFEELMNEKAFVLQFYRMNEPFYLLLTGFTTRSLNTDELKRKFYLIIIANTNDNTIGKSSQKDLTGMLETFSVLTRQAGISFVPIVVAGNAFTIGNTKKVLDTIRPATRDIVFFYYTGHGFRYSNDVSKYPRISFRTNNVQLRGENNLAVEDVYKQLLAKRALVTIVISDCCNEKLGASVPFGMDVLRPRATGTDGLKLNYDTFRKLFLPNQKTSVIIASAAPNQLAVGNPDMGGFFTNFFKAELIKSLYSNTGESSWLRISINASEKTRAQSLTALCNSTPNVQGRCVQRAELRVLPPL